MTVDILFIKCSVSEWMLDFKRSMLKSPASKISVLRLDILVNMVSKAIINLSISLLSTLSGRYNTNDMLHYTSTAYFN